MHIAHIKSKIKIMHHARSCESKIDNATTDRAFCSCEPVMNTKSAEAFSLTLPDIPVSSKKTAKESPDQSSMTSRDTWRDSRGQVRKQGTNCSRHKSIEQFKKKVCLLPPLINQPTRRCIKMQGQ